MSCRMQNGRRSMLCARPGVRALLAYVAGAKADKENSTSGKAANVPAAVAGEGIVRKPHVPKAHR